MKIKTAIIGLGRIAHGYEGDAKALFGMRYATHLSAIAKHKGFELVAASDIFAESRESFRKASEKFKIKISIYSDWQKMVKEIMPELVVVATNTESHAEIVSSLIDMGVKNILCEKPIASSLRDAEALVKKADKVGCNIFVNYFRAFTPSYVNLVNMIRNGYLGKIQTFDAKYTRGLYNNGTHFIDLLIRMFGEVGSTRGFRKADIKDFKGDPTLSANIEFKNGVTGILTGMNNDFYNILELDILGELGRVRIVNEKSELYFAEKSDKVLGYSSLKLRPNSRPTSIKDGLYPVYQNIYKSICNKGVNLCSAKDSLGILKVADQIIKSIK